ncbi:DsbC domain-containing protein [Caenorhabditis elegans]|uniref:DsbC domain-containing protein n=1 Tax=Caenorhabditis elegans TaxID=6239 RepID=Q9N5H0_CAEEL|nr:DsbC domain-containing protein [Caenorhabditis elegans]CCD72968.1 DsbC domain-containing protein [Caenorhabditis elegans]|eukprot:NP_494377.2 Uncharacterized protein CELE_K12H6.8 [Caenorhabditis elegans]
MRIILLLLALTAFSVASPEWKALFDIQSKLILSAYRNRAPATLYSLIPVGHDIDRYLGPNDVRRVQILSAHGSSRWARALAAITEYDGFAPKFNYALLDLTQSPTSPTGYTMSKGFICTHIMCEGEWPPPQ